MQYRPLGKTGLSVSEIGYGAWGIGGSGWIGALDEGGLTGRITPDATFPDGDFRSSFFGGDRKAQVKQHVDALVADLGIEADQIAEVALRYVLSRDAVSTVIAGMRTVRNVERNAAVGDGRGLSAGQQAIVAKHRWERNFYQA